MKISAILAIKGTEVVTIQPDRTVRDAARLLASHNIGGLIVVEEAGSPIGILSERDVTQAAARSDDFLDRHVDDVMTRNPIAGTPEDDVTAVLETMTTNRFRHLPVMDGGRLVGMISIGDVVKCQLQCYEGEIHMLQHRVMEP